MPEATTPLTPLYGRYRRKVTLACEACRKKRAKCSGTFPCFSCTKNQRTCNFDDTNRGRRGPRPHSNTQIPKVTRELAPGPPRRTSTENLTENLADNLADNLAENLAENSTERLAGAKPTEPATAVVDEDQNDDDSDEDSFGRDDIPPPSAWQSGLQLILLDEATPASECWDIPNVDLMAHLVELFCKRANALLRFLLPPADLLDKVALGLCPRSLLLAVCACSVRFSVHKAARGPSTHRLDEQLEQRARAQLAVSCPLGQDLGELQSYCVLIEYAASRGNGRRAWVDIAIARSMLQIARARANMSTQELQALDRVQRYLDIVEASHCIGQVTLQPPYGIWDAQRKLSLQDSHENESLSRFLELLHIFTRIQGLCSISFFNHDPPPWSIDSAFRGIQSELERILLHWPDQFRTTTSSPPDWSRDNDAESALCSLIWHCCVIVLNRTFLPIPQIAEADGRNSQGTRKCVCFPGAPGLFLEERIHRCKASAAAICNICSDLIASGDFFYMSPQPHDPLIANNLRFMFIVLGAVSKFYAPAHDWIDVLFRIYDINTSLKHVSSTCKEAFLSYYNRYTNIKEPGFVPLDPTINVPPQVQPPQEWNPLEVQPSTRTAVAQVQNDTLHDEEDWLRDYARRLSEDISMDGEERARADQAGGGPVILSYGQETSNAQMPVMANNSVEMADTSMTGTAMPHPAMEVGQTVEGWNDAWLGLPQGMLPMGDFDSDNGDYGAKLLEQLMIDSHEIWMDMLQNHGADESIPLTQ
ncbi:hypothetical protein N7519_007807 [Penicillium mononematosum]|uniref:uncharacterized protein n=1 Tax=Penicillium mononematosum TaxID=268346 RepID=UPI00254941DC|nr:uncharacterized protein N7519_007807 [Penicillium mononematosum]KAJ6186506.1 hypothetical protein N7519_007807 [Penicillium mononematosum]